MKHQLKTGQVLNAEEWQTWREKGMSTPEIATMLGITPSMVRVIGRKFRAAGYNDPQYRKQKSVKPQQLDTSTEAGAYLLGILWGTMGQWEEGYWLRHRDRWYIDAVRAVLGIEPEPQEAKSRSGLQYRLKIVSARDVRTIENILRAHGWAARKAPERPYPSGSLDDRSFIRAWVELHGAVDIRQQKRRNGSYYPQRRLRIYGNWALIGEMNYIISAATGLNPRTLQRTPNNITKALYYQGKVVTPVTDWLYDEAEIFNPRVRARIQLAGD